MSGEQESKESVTVASKIGVRRLDAKMCYELQPLLWKLLFFIFFFICFDFFFLESIR